MKLTYIAFYIIALLIGLILGLLIGWSIFSPKPQPQPVLTSRAVVDRVSPKGVLITRSVLVDQKATIKVDQGSDWSNFFWGYELDARGEMKVDIGVDLAKLKESDVVVDNTAKTICIKYPPAEITSVSLEGDIEMTSKSGIIKMLLANDKTKDFNMALNKLRDEATANIKGRTEFMQEAQNAADTTLTFLFSNADYKTVSSCRATN